MVGPAVRIGSLMNDILGFLLAIGAPLAFLAVGVVLLLKLGPADWSLFRRRPDEGGRTVSRRRSRAPGSSPSRRQVRAVTRRAMGPRVRR